MVGEDAHSGVEHGDALIAFAEAVTGEDEPTLSGAREALIGAMGADAMVEAAGVVSNFERMVRIAEGTGIPLDGFRERATEEMRADLKLNEFAAAAYTLNRP